MGYQKTRTLTNRQIFAEELRNRLVLLLLAIPGILLTKEFVIIFIPPMYYTVPWVCVVGVIASFLIALTPTILWSWIVAIYKIRRNDRVRTYFISTYSDF